MEFDLTEEQAACVATARDFARERLLPHAGQWDEDRTFPADALREAAALGFAAIYVPEAFGGSGVVPAGRGADLRGAGRRPTRPPPPSCRSTTWSPG